jgi:hypothetical protein
VPPISYLVDLSEPDPDSMCLVAYCPYSVIEYPQMKCYNGIYVKKQAAIVPCGRCMACRINKGRQWTARILMEQAGCQYRSYFQTFTYAEQTVPKAQNTDYVLTLKKKKFLQWLNNQTKEFGPFRYYAVGEYGDLYGRPHYHVALFPSHDSQVTELRHAWRRRYGHTDEIELNAKLARYLAQYACKKLTSWDDDRLEENQEPEFRESSRRPPLGDYITRQIAHRYSSGALAQVAKERGDVERTIRLAGRIYPLPDWSLRQIRKAAGIPLKHEDRILNNPAYLDYHPIEEAECNEQKHLAQGHRVHAQTKKKRINNHSF